MTYNKLLQIITNQKMTNLSKDEKRYEHSRKYQGKDSGRYRFY